MGCIASHYNEIEEIEPSGSHARSSAEIKQRHCGNILIYREPTYKDVEISVDEFDEDEGAYKARRSEIQVPDENGKLFWRNIIDALVLNFHMDMSTVSCRYDVSIDVWSRRLHCQEWHRDASELVCGKVLMVDLKRPVHIEYRARYSLYAGSLTVSAFGSERIIDIICRGAMRCGRITADSAESLVVVKRSANFDIDALVQGFFLQSAAFGAGKDLFNVVVRYFGETHIRMSTSDLRATLIQNNMKPGTKLTVSING